MIKNLCVENSCHAFLFACAVVIPCCYMYISLDERHKGFITNHLHTQLDHFASTLTIGYLSANISPGDEVPFFNICERCNENVCMYNNTPRCLLGGALKHRANQAAS